MDTLKETKEELLERMPKGSDKAVSKMAEKVAADIKRARRVLKSFHGKRNRRAFIRQERPHIVASKERGLEKIWAFHRRASNILAYHRYLVWHRETLAYDRELTDGDPRVKKEAHFLHWALWCEKYRGYISDAAERLKDHYDNHVLEYMSKEAENEANSSS